MDRLRRTAVIICLLCGLSVYAVPLDKASVLKRIDELDYCESDQDFEKQWNKLDRYVSHSESSELRYRLSRAKVMYYYYASKIDTMEKYAPSAMSYSRKHSDLNSYYFLWSTIADAYTHDGKITKALEISSQMSKEAKEKREDIGMAYSAYTIAMAYYTRKDTKKANEYFDKALPLLYETKNWSTYIIASANYLGNLILEDQTLKAHQVFKQLDELIDRSQKDKSVKIGKEMYPIVKGLLAAQVFDELHDVKQLNRYRLQTEQFYKDNGTEFSRESLYKIEQKYALAINDYKTENKYIDSLFVIYEGDVANSYQLYEARSNLYERMGRYKDALEQLKIYEKEYNSVKDDESQEQLAMYSSEYDLYQLELDKKALQLKVAKKQVNIYIIITVFLLISILTITYFLRRLSKMNRQLKLAIGVKDQFLHHITHQIRTPMNYMSGAVSLITENMSNPENEDLMNLMKKGQMELLKTIDDISDLSELDDDRKKYPMTAFDIDSCCREIEDKVRCLIPENVKFQYSNTLADNVVIYNNEALSKILFQFLDNSAKATSEGTISLSCFNENDHIVVSVKDTGKGIPEEYRAIIFDRFAKVNEYDLGLGIGLTIAKRIADITGASIVSRPLQSAGYEFRLVLPLIRSLNN